MSVTLRDPTDRLLDLPVQPLGPQPQREFHVDSRGSTILTDRGTGRSGHPRPEAGLQATKSMGDLGAGLADKILYRSRHFPVRWGSRSRKG
jgi:hypothetical protein